MSTEADRLTLLEEMFLLYLQKQHNHLVHQVKCKAGRLKYMWTRGDGTKAAKEALEEELIRTMKDEALAEALLPQHHVKTGAASFFRHHSDAVWILYNMLVPYTMRGLNEEEE